MMITSRAFAPSFPVPRACAACEAEAAAHAPAPTDSVTLSPPPAGPPASALAQQGLQTALKVGGSQCFAACPIHTGYWCDSTLGSHGVRHHCPMGHTWGLGQ